MVELYPFQLDLVNRIRAARARGARIIVVQAATGAGKTTIFSYLARAAIDKGSDVLVLVHRRRLVDQISERLIQFDVPHGVLMRGEPIVRHQPVQVASRDTFSSRVLNNDWIGMPPARLIIVDECFPAGTLIDGRPIEVIRPGDYVSSFNHETGVVQRRPVVRTFRSRPSALLEIKFVSGKRLVCTPGHPFYLPACGQYRAAALLCPGDSVTTIHSPGVSHEDSRKGMLLVQKAVRGQRPPTLPATLLLLTGVRAGEAHEGQFREDGRYEPEACPCPHEAEEPHAPREHSPESFCDHAITWSRAGSSRRERNRIIPLREATRPGHRPQPSRDPNGPLSGRERLPDAPQIRSRPRWDEALYRDRREEPSCPGQEGPGPAETGFLGVDWVESVALLQPASRGRHGRLSASDCVYNIEVDGNHNYFANGILVHNCHHAAKSDSEYRRILDRYPDATVLLFSATPVGPDGTGLGPWAQAIECAMPTSQLVRDGFLVPVRCYAPERKKKGKRFLRGIAGDLVESWRQYGEDRPTILFCARVQHSLDAVAACNAEGIPAAHVDAETTDKERNRVYDDVAVGRLKILSNVGIVGEGVDVPELGCCQIYCECNSRVRFIQMCGRVMRKAPGKTHGILIDHSGSVFRHGFPDEDTEWTLEGNADAAFAARHKDGETKKALYCKSCELAYHGSLTCPQCGRAPVKPPRSIFAPPPVRPRNELLTEAERGDGPDPWGREEKVRTWFASLRVALKQTGRFNQALGIYMNKYKEFPEDSFPIMPGRQQWKERILDLYPDFGRKKS